MKKFKLWLPLVLIPGILLSGCATYVRNLQSIPTSESSFTLNEPIRDVLFENEFKTILEQAVQECNDKSMTMNNIWATLVDLRDKNYPRMASYRGNEKRYPASVVKMIYMVATFRQIDLGELKLTRDLKKDLFLMIKYSDNEATNRILDRLTNTVSGDNLDDYNFNIFTYKRNWVNQYISELGFTGSYACQKTWSDTPFGRDVQFLGYPDESHFKNSNKMTTDDTARLLYLIEKGRIVSKSACKKMKKLMRRKLDAKSTFMNGAVPKYAKVFSKAGYISGEKDDAAIIDLGDGKKFILVVFTIFDKNETDIMRIITRKVVEYFEKPQEIAIIK